MPTFDNDDDDPVSWEGDPDDSNDDYDPADWEVANVTATIDDNGNTSFVVELDDGRVIHLGEHGGFSDEYLDQLYDQYGDDWLDELVDVVLENSYGETT